MFGSLATLPSQAPLVQKPPLAWLARNAQIGRFSSAWLAPCSRELARLAIPCVGRWREDPRVTSPVPAIHRLYIFPPAASLSSSSCRTPSAPPVSSTSSSSSPVVLDGFVAS